MYRMTTPVQTDFKINLPGDVHQRCTLQISETGDLVTCDGTEKLVSQLIRAVVNEDTITRNMINEKVNLERSLTALLTSVFRNFRSVQVEEVNTTDVNFNGFNFYRRAAGTRGTYALVSKNPVKWRFIDNNLFNDTLYEYGVTKVFRNTFETSYLDKFSIRPSSNATNQRTVMGQDVVAMSGNKNITFYVNYNRLFKASELSEEISNIYVTQSETDPRKYTVEFTVEDHLGNKNNLTAYRLMASNLRA